MKGHEKKKVWFMSQPRTGYQRFRTEKDFQRHTIIKPGVQKSCKSERAAAVSHVTVPPRCTAASRLPTGGTVQRVVSTFQRLRIQARVCIHGGHHEHQMQSRGVWQVVISGGLLPRTFENQTSTSSAVRSSSSRQVNRLQGPHLQEPRRSRPSLLE